MNKGGYYVDTCIWLNLFKKEGDPSKGIPYWKIAHDFIDKAITTKDEIFYSSQVLNEIKYKLADDAKFKARGSYLEENFIFVKTIEEDYILARELESKSKFKISFYDCIHIAICKRRDCVLITRDKLLIEFAKYYIRVKKPEEV